MTLETASSASPTPEPSHSKRQRLLLILLGGLCLIGGGYGTYYWLVASHVVFTDNAYVGAESASITPLINGQVVAVNVHDTQKVRQGSVLLQLEDTDYRIAVAQAEADLALAERHYEQTNATTGALAATERARQAEINQAQVQLVAAQADYERARLYYERRKQLVSEGAVSRDDMSSAISSLHTSEANVTLAKAAVNQAGAARASAEHERLANDALITGASRTTAPEVLSARAKRDQALLDLSRTVIRAPIDGVITQRNVQVGQRLTAGTAVMTLVPVDQLYVDANYKEGQLGRVKPGQSVVLTSDLYGSSVVYHGKVTGFAGGTGAAFALIPAQNATGNWIKVVQRLPVRISLDPNELQEHPLRVGLSMETTISLDE